MVEFTLSVQQLERLIKTANSDEEQEDMLNFKLRDGRLIITQFDWGHDKTKTLMDKPY
ncbi:hypothetical protein [Sporosarcina sp. P17b]|uniref:hypothetical protein n=1 Tax=Sporosarcina sp. P17b TaxID=2048260 RepID=UPI0013040BD7|nr:hypothetical protein [Sporosarcina sp. P17b]